MSFYLYDEASDSQKISEQMDRVWRPEKDPPRIWKHGDLSQKAQKAMLDLQARYRVKKDEFFSPSPVPWRRQDSVQGAYWIKEEPAWTPSSGTPGSLRTGVHQPPEPSLFGRRNAPSGRDSAPASFTAASSTTAPPASPSAMSSASSTAASSCTTAGDTEENSQRASEDALAAVKEAAPQWSPCGRRPGPEGTWSNSAQGDRQADHQIYHCSISIRLKQHDQIRKSMQHVPDCQTEALDAGNACLWKKPSSDKRKGAQPSDSRLSKTQTSRKQKKLKSDGMKEQKIDKFLGGYAEEKMNVNDFPRGQRTEIPEYIKSAQRICVTLKYTDGSTLVSRVTDERKKLGSFKSSVPESVLVHVTKSGNNTNGDSNVQEDELEISLPRGQHEEFNSLKTLIEIFGSSQTSKVIFAAKDFTRILLEHLQGRLEVNTQDWLFLDPLIGMWLLNPDKTLTTLQEISKQLDIRDETLSATKVDHSKEMVLVNSAMERIEERLREKGMHRLFVEVEAPLVPILAQMELNPIKIDTLILLSFSDALKRSLTRLEDEAHRAAGHPFLLNSHVQLRQVLYEELKLDQKLPANCRMKRTSVEQQKSTSEAMLSQLKACHPLPGIMLEYRQLQKLRSTYVEGLLGCAAGGQLHTHWDQTAAATGRLTSHTPNVQTVPKQPVTIATRQTPQAEGKAEERREIYAREPFTCHDGFVLLAADFQQIELRLLAHLTNDGKLMQAFDVADKDIFNQLASQWLERDVSSIRHSEREQAKRIVYSVMYGVGKEKLAEYLKVSKESAKAIMQSFLSKFPAVSAFTRKCEVSCKQHGYTSTIFNRRRLIPFISHPNHEVRAQALRQAVNFPVQGSAADLCKAAMLQVDRALRERNLTARLLMQIHDELLWEVQEDQLEDVKSLVKSVMEDSSRLCGGMATLHVPLKVSLSSGKSWAHLQSSWP